MNTVPRGLRINNPLNIRKSGISWRGMSIEQPDTDFVAFKTPELGIRAACRILANYQMSGIKTIKAMIYRWAPPSDNNPTDIYAETVAKACGCHTEDTIDIVKLLHLIVPAMIRVEQGQQPFSDVVIKTGIEDAFA